ERLCWPLLWCTCRSLRWWSLPTSRLRELRLVRPLLFEELFLHRLRSTASRLIDARLSLPARFPLGRPALTGWRPAARLVHEIEIAHGRLTGAGRCSAGVLIQCARRSPEDLVEDNRAEGAERDTVEIEVAQRPGQVGRADDQRHRRDKENDALREIDTVVDPDTDTGRGDQTEEDDGHTAEDAEGDRVDQRAEFRREAEEQGDAGGDDEDRVREDARYGHHANILGVGGHTGTATEAGYGGRDTVTDESTPEVRHEVSAGHLGDGLDVPGVLRHKHDRDRRDQPDGAAVK